MLDLNEIDGTKTRRDETLFSVGSVLHFAQTGDVVWGSGVNGKVASEPHRHRFTSLDVRAVRGPRTHEFLTKMGISVPEVFGDPGLLLPAMMPSLRRLTTEPKRHELTVIPNLNDFAAQNPLYKPVYPRLPLNQILDTIAHSELVVGSSLHGIVIAESLGIPARLVRSPTEDSFKYHDYFEGTGRFGYEIADSVDDAISMGGSPSPQLDLTGLMDSFPTDLWR